MAETTSDTAIKKHGLDGGSEDETVAAVENGIVVNHSGYKDQLKRQYGLLGIAGIALTVDNAWVALGSSISVSILNGGPSGLIFGLIVALFYYTFIGLGLSEFASSVPTAGGVYHWATIAGGPKYGRFLGFVTGWINFYGWMFDLSALVQITANISVNMYVIYHKDTYVHEPWHVYIAYLLVLWICAGMVIFANRLLPHTQNLGMFFVVVGGIVTIIVLAAMPKQHASNHFVWNSFDENNLTGWQPGVAFLLGVLNGAFTVGTPEPDAITHIAEELPHPRRDLPIAIALQIGLGFLYAFCFAIVLCYAITDLAILQGGINTYPLVDIYLQATADGQGNQNLGATFGLLFIIWCASMLCCIGTTLTNSRIYWALARDKAVPLSSLFSQVNEKLSCPIPATLFVAIVATGIGAIPLGSEVAFLNLAGSFIILTTVSYAIPFGANILTGRRHFPKGPFHLGKFGMPVNILAVLFITLFDIFYCFPYAMPTNAEIMNYNSVILAGVVFITGAWWLLHARKHYPGPKVMALYVHEDGHVLQAAASTGPAGEGQMVGEKKG
ncbi:putative amino acid transporter [Podospora australis]|uniref:Amino acid transporter n=1 Tax=Podospora australis TaxID=1536484 RepID=A0AAN6X3R1_9PEZI|nr:putative amino acid transporter [Podospora australis]